MSKKLLVLLVCFGALFALPLGSRAQGTLIHYWHFNNYDMDQHTDTIHGINADYSIHDVSKTSILYTTIPGTSVSYDSRLDSLTPPTTDNDTFNARMGTLPGKVLRVRNPSDSMQLLFYIPTVHYKNILLKYGVEKSDGAGMLQQVFDYSVDSGATWRTTGLTNLSDSAKNTFHLVAISFGSDTQVNNNAKLIFRIKFLGSNTGASGNNRFDNVTVDGDSITTGSTEAVQQFAVPVTYTLYPNPVINTVQLSGTTQGDKMVTVYNALGAVVMQAQKNGRSFGLNVSALATGSYYIRIRENNTNELTTVKFVKQ